MITRILYTEEKDQYNSVVRHPIQTWEWGDFQISQGHKVHRLGIFEKNKMVAAYSVSFHKLPHTNFSVGTVLRGPKINQEMITNLAKIGHDENAVFIKLEPDIYHQVSDPSEEISFPSLVVSPKVAFFPYSYIVDLTKSEDELLASLHSKTRYNVKVANRYGVQVHEATNDQGFEIYLKLLFETTKRQQFYLHTEKYHRDLWSILKKTDIPHILIASYQGQALAAFMLFHLKDRFFYPYGASLDINRSVMAPNLLMWEAVKLGKKLNCSTFDMWGSLGPNAKEGDQGFGFHKFKQGYGGDLVQFVGTYDLVINPQLYQIYNIVDKARWKALRLRAKVGI